MESRIRTYRDLVVWQKAMDVALAVLRLPGGLKHPNLFALADQLRRAAISVPSNVAEGHGRRSRGEYIRYVAIATGSLRELETQLLLLGRLVPDLGGETDVLLVQTDEVGGKLKIGRASWRERG